MRIFYAAAAMVLILLASGCVNVRYIGDVYPPTHSVRFFMNEKDIPAKTYREMGVATVSINEDDAVFHSSNVLSDALKEKAMEVGADAIVIVSNERHKVGTRHSSSSNTYYTERERERTKGHYGRHHGVKKSRRTTRGHADTYTYGNEYDIIRDEVKAKFLKLNSAR